MIQVVEAKEDLHFRIELERQIKAPAVDVFDVLIADLGPEGAGPDGTPFPMVLELFPGGRWYRDLGDDNGHFWAHVQAVKRSSLIELSGPLFMSNAVSNNVQYRLSEEDGVTTLRLVHEAFGCVPEHALEGMGPGWAHQMDRIAEKFA